jgi:hypothetical protein
VYADMTGGRFAPLADAAGALGVALLLVALVLRSSALVPWAIFFTGAGYLAGREGKALVDGWAALVGVLLLLTAELAAWSIEHDARIRSELSLTIRRIVTLSILAAAALLANFLLLGTAAVAAGPGVVIAAVGVAASVAAVAVVLRLARS